MKCEEIQSLLIEYIDGNLSNDLTSEIKDHLKNCPACRKEQEELNQVFSTLQKYRMESPDDSLRQNFNDVLREEIDHLKVNETIRETPMKRIISIKWASPFLRIAAAIILLVSGVWMGIFIQSSSQRNESDLLSELKNEVKNMKELLMFTMLNGESASQRIKAINYSSEIPYPNKKVIDALISTLNEDKNVNVRLAAAYSLERFWNIQQVRDSLIVSLDRQTEPILQIVLINILTEKKEVRAVHPIREIISRENTIREVKDIAEKSIRVLM